MIDFLTPITSPLDDETVLYSETNIVEKATEVIRLPTAQGILAVYEDDQIIHYALFDWYYASDDVKGYQCLFSGKGYGGAMREMRYTYSGEGDNGGYIYYADLRLLVEALTALGKRFD